MVFHNWTHDEELALNVIWPIHEDIETTIKILEEWEKSYQNHQIYQWAIVLKETEDVFRSISLFHMMMFSHKSETICQFGYCLSRKYWNQGIATKATYKMLAFAFKSVGVTGIKARHDIQNISSQRVIEKLGMHCEGLLKKVCRNAKGDWIDCQVYSLLKEDFLNFKHNRYVSPHPS